MDIITFITAAILLSSSSAIPPAGRDERTRPSSAIPPAGQDERTAIPPAGQDERTRPSSAIPPAGRDERAQPSIASCVMLIFNPPLEGQPKMKNLQCRDLLRSIALVYRKTGRLSPEYVEALKKVPKFKKNPSLLHKYLRGLSE